MGRVSKTQQLILWEYLYANKDLAVTYSRRTHAKETAQMKWQEVAALLNSAGDGVEKQWKGWSRYWVELKSKIKKKNAALHDEQLKSEAEPLTYMEKKFLIILGKGCGIGRKDVQGDPLTEKSSSTITQDIKQEENNTPGQPSTESFSSHISDLHTNASAEERANDSFEDLSDDIYAPIVELKESPADAESQTVEQSQRQERGEGEARPVDDEPQRVNPPRLSQQNQNQSPLRNRRRLLNRDRPYFTSDQTRRLMIDSATRRADATERIAEALESIIPILINIERNTRRN